MTKLLAMLAITLAATLSGIAGSTPAQASPAVALPTPTVASDHALAKRCGWLSCCPSPWDPVPAGVVCPL